MVSTARGMSTRSASTSNAPRGQERARARWMPGWPGRDVRLAALARLDPGAFGARLPRRDPDPRLPAGRRPTEVGDREAVEGAGSLAGCLPRDPLRRGFRLAPVRSGADRQGPPLITTWTCRIHQRQASAPRG